MVYFLSDAHLGSRVIQDPDAHQQRVIDLLHTMGKDATAIYLLGDMFDFWYEYVWHRRESLDDYERRTQGKTSFAPFLRCLRELTNQGIEVHYFIGNHDIWTFGWLTRVTGVQVHRGPLDTTINGKRILMAHGDGLVPDSFMRALKGQEPSTLTPADKRRIRAFIWLRRFFHSRVPQYMFRLMPPAWGDGIGYTWAKNSRQKELDHPYPYKGEEKEELVRFAKEKEQQTHHDYYIFGHRHIELDLQITRDARILILGDMFKLWTYARMDEKGNLELLNCD